MGTLTLIYRLTVFKLSVRFLLGWIKLNATFDTQLLKLWRFFVIIANIETELKGDRPPPPPLDLRILEVQGQKGPETCLFRCFKRF